MRKTLFPLLAIMICIRCASITTPTGGPKDKIPPHLLASIPKPNQTNFKGKSVELSFDETVKLNSPKEEIIISPSPGAEIEIKNKGTKVTITPKAGWKDTTTYSISFREGIQDITESNSPPNLKLAFSTGALIDSLRLSGTVHDILDGTPHEKITVAIYQSDTFDIFTDAPNYFTKTDKQGKFKLENIKAGSYRIYAFDDKNKNLKTESRNEMYGFLSRTLQLSKNLDSLNIGLIRLDTRQLKLSSIRNVGNITRLRFNKSITDYSTKSEINIINSLVANQTEIVFWNPDGDSVQIHVSASDSVQNKIDTSFFVKKTRIKPIVEKFTWSLGTPTVDPENGSFTTTLKYSKPISAFNFDSLSLQIDSTHQVAFTKEDVAANLRSREATITKGLDKKLFGNDNDPHLILRAGKAFINSIDGDTSKVLLSPVLIYWPEENAVISFLVQTKEKNYVVQIIDKNLNKIVLSLINPTKFTAKNIPPSEYQIRIIIDENKNGKWDPGNIKINQEPERIIYYRSAEGAANFPVRANWELGPLIIKF